MYAHPIAEASLTVEYVRDALRKIAPNDVEDQRDFLVFALDDALSKLEVASIPPVSGGAPDGIDDFEDIDPDFLANPDEWPSWTDRHRWEIGTPADDEPTPDEVLNESRPVPFEFPTLSDCDASGYDDALRLTAFEDFAAALLVQGDGPLSDADIMAAGLPVG